MEACGGIPLQPTGGSVGEGRSHWLGPLEDAAVHDGCITCPWHGYRFDVRTGASADGRGLRLGAAPRVAIERGRVVLRPAE